MRRQSGTSIATLQADALGTALQLVPGWDGYGRKWRKPGCLFCVIRGVQRAMPAGLEPGPVLARCAIGADVVPPEFIAASLESHPEIACVFGHRASAGGHSRRSGAAI